MTRIEKQILKSQIRIAKLKAKAQKIKQREASKPEKAARPRGRPKLNPALIERAKELARNKPIADVAFKLGVSCRSLYNYGISRAALVKKSQSEYSGKRKGKP
ncbi:MAG: hypothetical protein M3T96_11240 [Acidobacteriota bacterium]|nr:hypothetical protein [Acidobacteriota bacterium]